MQFEKFRGTAMYYVTEWNAAKTARAEAIAEVAKMTKMQKGRYQVITVWIQRDVDGWDLLWTEPEDGAERMMAVVRKEAVR